MTKADIAEAIRMKKTGLRQKDIAAYLGIAEETMSRWVNHPKTENQRQLSQALKKTEAERKASLLTMIYNAATAPKTWQAAAWLLERQYPDEFAQQQRVRAEAEVEVAPAFYFDPKEADG
ncbi:XRE family transcriptional regulator [Enterorhabdus caecimuris]|nr:XRE family transcriptional regulator [Adlercreutzia caecimuris]